NLIAMKGPSSGTRFEPVVFPLKLPGTATRLSIEDLSVDLQGAEFKDDGREISVYFTPQHDCEFSVFWRGWRVCTKKFQVTDVESVGRLVGWEGKGPGQFHSPCGLAISKLGEIYVADK